MLHAPCFDSTTLREYLLGKLPDEQSDLISSHLDQCRTCEATVAGLDSAVDTLTSGLKVPSHVPVAVLSSANEAQEPELAAALERVQALSSADSASSARSELSSPLPKVERPHQMLRDYRLLESIGAGGMGTVFKAVHMRLDRLVAVKLLPARRLGDEQAVNRFQREMRVIGQLSHSAIVQATDAGEVDGTHFLVMEYVEGMDLNRVCRLCGPLSIADACEITRQAALGLEYAHQQGVVHRDIKPSNVMLSVLGTSQVSVKLLDLGLALLSGVQAPVDELTTVGQLMGTLDYMAPEQFEDCHQVDSRADIYALAATLYRLLTGVPPYGSLPKDSPLKKLKVLATEVPMPTCQRRADIPRELGELIDRALSREPETRFPSMREFADVLSPWCAGHNLNSLWQQAVAANTAALSAAEALEHSSLSEPVASVLKGATAPSQFSSTRNSQISALRDDGIQRFSVNAASSSRQSTWMKLIGAVMALVLCGALGAVITITTDKGELVVESLKEGVEVRLKKSGRIVEQMQVTHGSYKTRIAAGEYELELVSDADSLQVERGKFELKRGDTVVARIVERPRTANQAEPIIAATPQSAVAVEPKRPTQLLDLKAKGMETFEATNSGLASELKIRAALAKTADVNFVDQPLEEVLAFLSDLSGVEFAVDKVSFGAEGIPLDSLVNLHLKGMPVASALHFVTNDLGLAWTIDDQRIIVTTPSDVSEKRLVTRFYPVGRIMPAIQYTLDMNRHRQAAVLSTLNQTGVMGGGGGGGFGGGGGMFSVVEGTRLLGSSAAISRATFHQFGGGGFGGGGQPPELNLEYTFLNLFDWLPQSGWMNSPIGSGGGTLKLLNNVLIVRQPIVVQWQVESLLRSVEAAFDKPSQPPKLVNLFANPQPQTDQILQRLNKPLDVNLTETQLAEVVEFLSASLECNVRLDRRALKDAAIAEDAPVTLRLTGASGQVALRTILEPLGLGSLIEHGVLVITTVDAANERLVPKIYDARSFADRKVDTTKLMAAITEETSGGWEQDGDGNGTFSTLAETLVFVAQTSKVHQEIEELFQTLDRVLDHRPAKDATVKP